jgi:hypothetical protein
MTGKLKPLDIDCEEKPGNYADGDGLYLIVAGPTSKNWSYRYWFKGKERWHGLGSFKDVSLKQARLLRDAARLQVRAGVDLVQEKRAAREEKKEGHRGNRHPAAARRRLEITTFGAEAPKSALGPAREN